MTGRRRRTGATASASDALAVLHELASSPETAADALALLHELQVHQVELDLQAEELRESRAELESALRRQIELYERAPVGCFTIDRGTVVHELNLTGADLLGDEPRRIGRANARRLSRAGQRPRAARDARARRAGSSPRVTCELQLRAPEGAPRVVHASVSADPAGERFLVAFMEIGEPKNEA